MGNFFPQNCGYNVASWWCPVTNKAFIYSIGCFIVATIIVLIVIKIATRDKMR